MPSITPSPQVLALASHQQPPPSGSSTADRPSPLSSSSGSIAAQPSLTSLLASAGKHSSPGKVRASRKYLPKHAWPKRAWWKLVSDGGSAVERRRAERPESEKQAERDRVAQCGSWVAHGMRPTDLFLDIYGSVLQTLNHNPRIGVVSPSLIGTTGTVPMTILSLIPDIIEHHATLIRGAQHEILLFTNYWQISNSQRSISDALITLSDRLGKENDEAAAAGSTAPRKKVVVKLVYDRGTLRHLVHPHSPVPPKMWPAIDLPKESQIPNLDMQVLNYHRLLVGTFHAKFLVVDRKAALVCSNNIQDRPNLEMMVHLEGDVVQSLYDTALISFSAPLHPTLPLLANPPAPLRPEEYLFQEKNPWLKAIPLVGAAEATRKLLRLLRDRAVYDEDEERKKLLMPERGRMRNMVRTMIEQGMEAPPKEQPVRSHSSAGAWFEGMVDVVTSAAERSRPQSRLPSRRNSHERKRGASLPAPGASRRNHSPPRHADPLTLGSPLSSQAPTATSQAEGPFTPTVDTPTESSGAPGEFADFHHKLETSLNSVPLTDQGHAHKHVTLLVDEPEEMMHQSEVQAAVRAAERAQPHLKDAALPSNAKVDTGSLTAEKGPSEADKALMSRLERMSQKLNAGVLSEPLPTVEDTDAIDDFTPHIFHAPHKPVPMALVNRGPRGTPGHQDLRTPQNAAWLAGFKYSKKRIFIQTPTFNARPVVDAAIDACKRGVEVILYVGLGFNDKGESIPFQGGTNEEVTMRMYKTLRAAKKEQYLKVYWYVGKDQNRPLNAVIKQRNCHVKLAIFDDAVGMCGNGNQDTQSWYHSQETNVLIDSKLICADWLHTLAHNQNTHLYGLVDPKDGRWRNEAGQTVEDLDRIALEAKEKEAEAQAAAGVKSS